MNKDQSGTYYTVNVTDNQDYIILNDTDTDSDVLKYNYDQYGDFTIQTSASQNGIRIGKQILTEQKLEKLLALLDIIDQLPDNEELKVLLNAQLGFNKIRGNNEDKSNK